MSLRGDTGRLDRETPKVITEEKLSTDLRGAFRNYNSGLYIKKNTFSIIYYDCHLKFDFELHKVMD